MTKVTVELTFPKELKDEPVIYCIVHNFELIPNILEASFSTELGWAILTLEGEKEEVERLFEYLRKKNVTITPR